MIRLFRYELRRLLANKWVYIAVILAICGAVDIILAVAFNAESLIVPSVDRERVLASYPELIAQCRYMLTAENVSYLDRQFYERQIELYTFLIQTNTITSDYFSANNHPQFIEGFEGICRLLYLNEHIIYVQMALAVAVGVWIFSAERAKGTFKNLLATNIPRKKLYFSKYLVGALVSLALPVIMIITSSIGAATMREGAFLVYDGGFRSGTTTEFLMQIMLRNLTVVAVIYTLSVLISEYFKPLVATLLTAVVYFAWVFISAMLTGNNNIYLLNYESVNAINYFPIIGLQNYLGGLTTTFLTLIPSHIALIAIFTVWTRWKFIRMDF